MNDEWAFMKREVFNRLCVPLLTPSHAVWIAISTLSTRHESYTKHIMASGKFPVKKFTLVCEDCRKLNKRTVCKHKASSKPPWTDGSRADVMQNLLKDDDETYKREILGFEDEIEDTTTCFNSKRIWEIFTCPREPIYKDYNYCFVAIDPCTGSNPTKGIRSHYAMVCMLTGGVIVAMEAFNANNQLHEVDELIVRTLRKLREHPFLQRTTLVIGVESYGGEAPRVEDYVRKHMQGIVFMSNFSYGKQGMKMDDKVKESMMNITRTNIDTNMMSISDDFFSLNMEKDKCLHLLRDEMLRTQYVLLNKESSDPRQRLRPNKYTISGKGHNFDLTDDLAVCVMWCYYMVHEFMFSPRYKDLRTARYR